MNSFSVKECLRGYTNEALATMCDYWQLAVSSKPNRIRAMEKVLSDPLHVENAIKRLSPADVRVMHLVASRPAVMAQDVLSVPGLLGNGHTQPALEAVAKQGLVLVSPEGHSGAFSFGQLSREKIDGNGAIPLVVPDTVRNLLPPAAPLGIRLDPVEGPLDPDSPAADLATATVLETFRVVEALEPRVTASGELHKSDRSRAIEIAKEGNVSSEAFDMALLMACRMGCIAARDGRLDTTEKAAAWAERGESERIRELFHAYLTADDLPDLRLFYTQLYDAIDQHMRPGALRRTYHRVLMANILAEQTPGVWFSIDQFVELIRRVDPNVLFLEERWLAIHCNVHDASPVWKDRSWQTREKRLFSWIIQSLFSRLGIVELAAQGKCFRITPLGRYALGVGPKPEENGAGTHDAVVVQPDFEVIAYVDRCSAELRRKLDLFCERLRGGPASTYKITQESIYRGVRSGVAAHTFVDLLTRHSARALPANVLDQLATWERKVQSVTIRTLCNVVECRTPNDAEAFLQNHPGARVIGERFVLVDVAVPDVTHRINYRKPLKPCLLQEDGLHLRAPWERRHLFVQRRISELGHVVAQSNGDIGVTLAKNGSNKGVDWGLHAANLDAIVIGPLAARFRVALRARAGEVAAARTGTATLVRFEEPETCDAVMELPAAGNFVEGRLGLYTVVVKQGRLAQFKKLLKSQGIPVDKVEDSFDDGAPDRWCFPWVETQRAAADQQAVAETADDVETDDAEAYVSLPSYSPRIIGEILEDAIRRRVPVLIQYKSVWEPNPSLRKVNPVAVDLLCPQPTLSGYCHKQGGVRDFKLSRILGIRVMEDESF
ncbi:MAG: hypothetical protein AMXMBFR84_21010 [Candidatus Hydrogenedentota bacterium]